MLNAAGILALLFVPHVAVFLHPRLVPERLSALELAINAPLLPLLTAATLVERTARLYWARARDGQVQTAAHQTAEFNATITSYFRHRRRRHWSYLLLASMTLLVIADVALRRGWLGSLVAAADVTEVRIALAIALASSIVLGIALFDAAAAITLGALTGVLASLGAALVASLLTAVAVIAWLQPSTAPLALLTGSCVSALLCRHHLRRALRHADHRYFAIL
jgi:hypothetical protein